MLNFLNDLRKYTEFNKIINSVYFKNLKNKTQLIPFDNRVTDRLKHSKMVCFVSESIYKQLNHKQNIDLYCLLTASLIHDIGHPPFGHDGERELHKIMSPYGGFESNAQSLYILKHKLYVNVDIINATFKHLTLIPHSSNDNKLTKGYYSFMQKDLQPLKNKRCIEKNIVDFPDEIAYAYSDIEDLFFNSKILHFPTFKKSKMYASIIRQLCNKYEFLFNTVAIERFVSEIEKIVIEIRSYTYYIKHMIENINLDNSLEGLMLPPIIQIQLDYLKALTKESYFKMSEYHINEKAIKRIIHTVFDYYLNNYSFQKAVPIKEQYRVICNKIYDQSEHSIVRLYREANNANQ